jgi:hypothetical protein
MKLAIKAAFIYFSSTDAICAIGDIMGMRLLVESVSTIKTV